MNFSAGPAYLPASVRYGLSQLVLSHSSPLFQSHLSSSNQEIWFDTQRKLRRFDNIPDDFEILLLPTSVRGLFSTLGQNFKSNKKIGFFLSGFWSLSAYRALSCSHEVTTFSVHCDNHRYIDPSRADIAFWVSNETLSGFQFHLNNSNLWKVVDKSSDYLTQPTNWDLIDCALIGTQKIFSFPGATLVIARRSFLEDLIYQKTPYNLRAQFLSNSTVSTRSNLHTWLIASLVDFYSTLGWKHLQSQRKRWKEKLYSIIDSTSFMMNQVPIKFRSDVNITWSLQPNYHIMFEDFFSQYECIGCKGHKNYSADFRLSLYPSFLADQKDDSFLCKFDDFVQSLPIDGYKLSDRLVTVHSQESKVNVG